MLNLNFGPLREQVDRDGYVVVPRLIDPDTAAVLADALSAVQDQKGVRRRHSVYAIRNLLQMVPEVRALAADPRVRSWIEPVLGPSCFAVRGILFDKTPDANWHVVWHQDLSIAVKARHETPGFGPWSEKAGVIHVQPPVAQMEDMLTIRLHLDACDESNGPLRVIPGSHRSGRLDPAAIGRWRAGAREVACPVPAGGALLMRPLLLHSSSAAAVPGHRRVIHLEYAVRSLPEKLAWLSQVQPGD